MFFLGEITANPVEQICSSFFSSTNAIAFRYVLGEQDMIFQMIDYLGQKLHYEKL